MKSLFSQIEVKSGTFSSSLRSSNIASNNQDYSIGTIQNSSSQGIDGAGVYPVQGNEYYFEVYAYKTYSGQKVFSAISTELYIYDLDWSAGGVVSLSGQWDAVPNADGYRVQIYQDPVVGANGDAYFDTTFTYLNIGVTQTGRDAVSNQTYIFPISGVVLSPVSHIDNDYTILDIGTGLFRGSMSIGSTGIPTAVLDVFGDAVIRGSITQPNNGAATVIIGGGAGGNSDNNGSILIGGGAGAGGSNGNLHTVALGYNAGYANTSSSYNSWVGYQAGYYNNGSSYNAGVGELAGCQGIQNTYSSFLGISAGASSRNLTNVVFLGNNAGYSTSGISDSIFVGRQAGMIMNNSSNVYYFGYLAGDSAHSSSDSVGFGRYVLHQASGNNNNLVVGYLPGVKLILVGRR